MSNCVVVLYDFSRRTSVVGALLNGVKCAEQSSKNLNDILPSVAFVLTFADLLL